MKLHLSIFFILVLTACNSNKMKREEIPGVYLYSEGGYKLELREDGTYHHSYTAAHGNVIEKTGTWELHSFGREILFKDFSFLTSSTAPADWNSKLRVEGNKIDLMYDWKDDIYYRRTIKK
ncbi:MAG TPA: hypothetical protein VL443_28670 [Cyclobacteriaceae bacterium]|jgi:hypothetical protein|nr:hypothetical protein [Cyclobacteriaceae bacterium]